VICHITDQCISCGACLLECKKNAIIVSENLKYRIDPNICNLCIGLSSLPKCKMVCPIEDAVIIIPSYSKIVNDVIL
jgi:ferredoxin